MRYSKNEKREYIKGLAILKTVNKRKDSRRNYSIKYYLEENLARFWVPMHKKCLMERVIPLK